MIERVGRPKAAKEFRESIAAEFLADLDAMEQSGQTPRWVQGWASQAPHNPVSNTLYGKTTTYRGMNVFWLLMKQGELMRATGTADSRWCTFNQLTRMKRDSFEPLTDEEYKRNREIYPGHADWIPTWSVRKGEHGTLIEYWFRSDKAKVSEADEDSDGPKASRSSLRFTTHRVFNFTQIEGAPQMAVRIWTDDLRAQGLASLMASSESRFKEYAGNTPYYAPPSDTIVMPPKAAFLTLDSYGETFCHEYAHSTGHASRLNRPSLTRIGSTREYIEDYAEEELVAEMAAFILASEIGLTPDMRSSLAYVADWKRKVNDDAGVLFRAASAATKAVGYAIERKLHYESELAPMVPAEIQPVCLSLAV